MKFRPKPILSSIILCLFCLNLACTVNISSSGIPTSIATLIKTISPTATLALDIPNHGHTVPLAVLL